MTGASQRGNFRYIEWPPGSRIVASYSDDERHILHAILEPGTPERKAEAAFLHALKAEFEPSLLREPYSYELEE